jgi:hypothetical protein
LFARKIRIVTLGFHTLQEETRQQDVPLEDASCIARFLLTSATIIHVSEKPYDGQEEDNLTALYIIYGHAVGGLNLLVFPDQGMNNNYFYLHQYPQGMTLEAIDRLQALVKNDTKLGGLRVCHSDVWKEAANKTSIKSDAR